MAAIALLRGWGDPMSMIDLEGVDNIIAQAIVDKANQLYAEEQKRIIDAMAIAVGNAVGRAFGG